MRRRGRLPKSTSQKGPRLLRIEYSGRLRRSPSNAAFASVTRCSRPAAAASQNQCSHVIREVGSLGVSQRILELSTAVVVECHDEIEHFDVLRVRLNGAPDHRIACSQSPAYPRRDPM